MTYLTFLEGGQLSWQSRNKLRGWNGKTAQSNIKILDIQYSRFLPGFDTLSRSSSGYYAFSDQSWRGLKPHNWIRNNTPEGGSFPLKEIVSQMYV